MIFKIENLPVYFPYDHIYPEQYEYMKELKRALDEKGHCLLQMPPGTGKTIALLSLITSYNLSKPQSPIKLVYCTPTVHEMEIILNELRLLYKYEGKNLDPEAYGRGKGHYCPDYIARGLFALTSTSSTLRWLELYQKNCKGKLLWFLMMKRRI